jgi:hypothetical protein
MIIRNVTQADLATALQYTSGVFGNNIEFFMAEPAGRTRQGGEKWHVRLTVKSSRGPGARRSADGSGRRVKAACWHVHGTFFDALPSEAEIIVAGEEDVHHPGDLWQDRNIGGLMNPMMHSDACDCESGPPKPFILPGKKEWRPD